jgi:hypothetical protein
VFYIAFLIVLQLAFSVFGANPVTDLLDGMIAFLPKLFVAILIVVITAAVATAVKTLLESFLSAFSYGRTLALIAAAAIWVIGVSAALNQIEVAPEIVNGLFYAMLALVVGIGIVAIGGGGIQPMRERWQRALTRIDQEAPRLREESRTGADAARWEVQDETDEVLRMPETPSAEPTDRYSG